ncbi:MAG: MFS transporter [Rhizomicrobium sp.]
MQPAAPLSAWIALTVFVAASLLAYVDRQILTLLAEPIRHALSLSDGQLGIILGLGFAIFTTVLVMPLGWLADRVDPRISLTLCVLVWATATAACGLTNSFGSMFLATVGIAAGEAGLTPIVYSVLPALFPYRQRVTANLIFYLASVVGSAGGLVLGGAAIGWLTHQHAHLPHAFQGWETWRLALFTVALPGPLLCAAILCLRLQRVHDIPAVSAETEGGPRLGAYLREHRTTLATFFVAIGVFVFAFQSAFSWFPVALTRYYGVSASSTGLILGSVMAAGTLAGVAISAVAMGRYVPSFGKGVAMRICRIAMAVSLPASLLFGFTTAAWQVYGLATILMVAGTAAGSLMPNMVQDLSPSNLRARIAALYMMVMITIGGMGGIAVGFVSDLLQTQPRALLLAIVAVSAPAWLLAYGLFRLGEPAFVATARTLAAPPDSALPAEPL